MKMHRNKNANEKENKIYVSINIYYNFYMLYILIKMDVNFFKDLRILYYIYLFIFHSLYTFYDFSRFCVLLLNYKLVHFRSTHTIYVYAKQVFSLPVRTKSSTVLPSVLRLFSITIFQSKYLSLWKWK